MNQVIPSPELHLMLGPNDELSKVWVDSERWLDTINVKKVDYQGGQFEGNECRAISKNIYVLGELSPPQFSQFVTIVHFIS